ncbi:uncharacterized protein PV09_02643 [Verruconis gallopava]|uniref:DUF1446 domain-containing protein n=1 Tax=Verruconis gallopava TaxID=253628 RepID=A0A0D2AKA3_9PEZI|nr:uncharacterized protein PV09_02643 [Verruconis gallopava]KIW06985.1 hypothetical protein PV09_02643 [Verruconis gallopava]
MPSRPIRIAGASGSASDRRHAILSLACNYPNDPIDLIIGDWMSEGNMTARAWSKVRGDPTDIAYEPTFLEAVTPALPYLAKYGIKLAVNAGASDPMGLCEVVRKLVKEKGLDLKVAWIEGDEVLPIIKTRVASGEEKFENICTGELLRDWKFEPISAQAYLGGLGIAEALRRGSDIVIAGRVSDASPVIGGAYWWHNWKRSDLDQLANAFVCGHLIECSTYVTGGNFTGFKDLEAEGWDDLGFPIAEISSSGEVIVTKQKGTQGRVTTDTCTSQLLYEIQGPWYFNSDVTAILDELWFEQLSENRVALRGVKSAPPPPTTKVGLTARPCYQVEFHFFPTGLDIDAKARMCEAQIRKAIGDHAKKFIKFEFTKNGTAMENPTNQNAATVDLRIFVQAREEQDVSPAKVLRPCLDSIMHSYPGSTPHLDFRQGFPKPAFEYYVTLIPQSDVDHKVHLESGETIRIDPPSVTKVWDKQQPSQPTTTQGVDLSTFGATTRGPLGWVAHARSGDKGSNANVGFWVKTDEQWNWLRTLLSVDKMKELLADEYKQGKKIDRFELPNARAVHFLLHDHLDRGVSCSSSYDFLAKNVAEFLRARHVDIPVKFLSRGKL